MTLTGSNYTDKLILTRTSDDQITLCGINESFTEALNMKTMTVAYYFQVSFTCLYSLIVRVPMSGTLTL